MDGPSSLRAPALAALQWIADLLARLLSLIAEPAPVWCGHQVAGRALYVAPAHKKPDLRPRGEAGSAPIGGGGGGGQMYEGVQPGPHWGMVPGAYPGAPRPPSPCSHTPRSGRPLLHPTCRNQIFELRRVHPFFA